MSSVRLIPLTYNAADSSASATRLIETLLPEWKESEGPIEFVHFTEGITNNLLKATKKRSGSSEHEIDQEAVLLRAYGNGTDVLIDREREASAHSLLASRGLAPPLLARFDNGLMYRFIEGDVCTPEDLRKPEVYRAVAKRLGEWHGSLPISAISTVPKRPHPLMNGETDSNKSVCERETHTRPMPNLWTVMQQWIDALPTGTPKEKERNQMLSNEAAKLSAELGDTPGLDGNDYIFSHCDLLSGNIIIQRPDGEPTEERPVSFIDYEYATPAPAAFDIANHFAEWAGFDCDHSAVPTVSQRRDFLKHYLASYRYNAIDDDASFVEHDLHNDLAQLYNQVELFRGIPGFYWGIWALIQTTISQIDFDYASYAEIRLGEYWSYKAEKDGSRAREGRDMPLRERRWAQE